MKFEGGANMLNRNIMSAMRMLQMKDEAGASGVPNAQTQWQRDTDPLFAATKDESNAWEVIAQRKKNGQQANASS